MSLEIDLTPLWEQINTNLPTFLGFFAVVGGISIAIALARLLINEVLKAFKGSGR